MLEHNAAGNVLSTTLLVRSESFAPEDITGVIDPEVRLMTTSAYNTQCELVSSTRPAGDRTEWVYSERDKDPLNQGNLQQVTEFPKTGVESDQASLVTRYEYEPKFQFITGIIDPRGNKTSYQYDIKGNLSASFYPAVTIQPVNDAVPRPPQVSKTQQTTYVYNSKGQLLRRTEIDGSATEFLYYPGTRPERGSRDTRRHRHANHDLWVSGARRSGRRWQTRHQRIRVRSIRKPDRGV